MNLIIFMLLEDTKAKQSCQFQIKHSFLQSALTTANVIQSTLGQELFGLFWWGRGTLLSRQGLPQQPGVASNSSQFPNLASYSVPWIQIFIALIPLIS